jgi:hypothetical protein
MSPPAVADGPPPVAFAEIDLSGVPRTRNPADVDLVSAGARGTTERAP